MLSVNSKQNLKNYFLPVYIVWAVLSPSIIILINPLPFNRLAAFYSLFGVIWPITFVVYPAFFIAFRENNVGLELLGFKLDFLVYPLFFVAWIGPVVHLIFAIVYHRQKIQQNAEKSVSWGSYFSGFI